MFCFAQVRKALGIALDIARGLEHLHALTPPIVHRDLKSDNILLDAAGRAKISDFVSFVFFWCFFECFSICECVVGAPVAQPVGLCHHLCVLRLMKVSTGIQP